MPWFFSSFTVTGQSPTSREFKKKKLGFFFYCLCAKIKQQSQLSYLSYNVKEHQLFLIKTLQWFQTFMNVVWTTECNFGRSSWERHKPIGKMTQNCCFSHLHALVPPVPTGPTASFSGVITVPGITHTVLGHEARGNEQNQGTLWLCRRSWPLPEKTSGVRASHQLPCSSWVPSPHLSSLGFWSFLKPQQLSSAAAAAKLLQLCPTLCDPIDGSPPGSLIPGILQARTLEWVAISFSNAWKWKVKVKSLNCVQLVAISWTAAHQASPPMGFSRQEY